MSENSSHFLIPQTCPRHLHLRQQAAQLPGAAASANGFSIGSHSLSFLAGVMLHLQGDQGSAPAQGFPLPPSVSKGSLGSTGGNPCPAHSLRPSP